MSAEREDDPKNEDIFWLYIFGQVLNPASRPFLKYVGGGSKPAGYIAPDEMVGAAADFADMAIVEAKKRGRLP